jgi:adenine-specific DNA methylase
MTCPRCHVTLGSDSLKEKLQEDDFDYQLYAIYYDTYTSGGCEFRKPNDKDFKAFKKATEFADSDVDISTSLTESIPSGEKTTELRRNGMTEWRDLFTPRQLLTHHTYWQKFEEVKQEIQDEYPKKQAESILVYLCLVADKALDYNSRMAQWDASQPKIGHMFAGSDFAFSWSFIEHNLTVEDHGYDWMLSNIAEDVYGGVRDLLENSDAPSEVLQGDAADLSIDDGDVDAVVLDPPYYGMIMYAELGDYFYVWMKKYLKDIIPDFFNSTLTEKENEAVANKSRFEGVESDELSKKELARREYEQKMANIFGEMYRVLNPSGIFTMMFTHKETEAWDTLTKALIESGFVVTASHPVNTENQHRVQQAGRNSADSTILLSSEKRDLQRSEPTLWEEVKKDTQVRAQEKVKQLESQEAEFTKVDMMLASFGPTLEIFTKNYPVVDDTGEEVSPQTALDEARGAVRDYLIEQYLNEGIRDVDAKTEWYVLAWFVFEAQRFPYDEGRRLAVGVGENVDSLKKENRMWRTKSGDIVLRPHGDRVQDVNKASENRSGRKPADPDSLSFSTALDKVHAAMHIYDVKGATEAWNWMNDRNSGSDPAFKATLEALLRVLPHDHNDWNIARDLAAGETGDLLDLELDTDIFKDDEEEEVQGRLKDF